MPLALLALPLAALLLVVIHVRTKYNRSRAAFNADLSYKDGVLAFAHGYRFTSTNMERLLASYRAYSAAAKTDKPEVERFVSTGFVGQMMRAHKSRHQVDCRAPSRDQFVNSGLKLRCCKKRRKSSNTKRASGFMIFWGEQQAAREASMSTLQYQTWQAEKAKESHIMGGRAAVDLFTSSKY